jgi:hypothetical protein
MNLNSDQSGNSDYQELAGKLYALEQRMTQLESDRKRYYSPSEEDEIEHEGISFKIKGPGSAQLESHIGEYGLAWLGNIVLFFGITFFVQYLQVSGFKVISPILGFASMAGIFVLAHYLRNSNPYMAKIFNLNSYLLFFYVTLKLHFFTDNPIISNKALGLILLLVATGILLFISMRKKYAVLAGLSLILLVVTAVLSDSTHVILSLVTLVSIIAIILLYRFGWIRLVFLSIFLVYFTNLLWMIGNPMMGHQIQTITYHHSGFIYLFFISAIFSLIALMPKKVEFYTDNSIIGSVIFNGLGFTFLITLFILSFFKENYILLTGSIALYCLVYSIILQIRSNWKITAGLYALFGFVTLSVTMYGIYDFPRAYFSLAIQSLLVVSMAIWFRSKFIVIMNSILFIILLMIYLSTSDQGNSMNISFSIVALATARILNWKKERLTIRTELIRNFYLVTAFLMVLYTLYHLIPNQYITLSWTVAAVIYFLTSLILKNVKYRYMALANMIAAALFLFIVDLARIELVYRVIALLFLAIISIGLSFYYFKKVKKKHNSNRSF